MSWILIIFIANTSIVTTGVNTWVNEPACVMAGKAVLKDNREIPLSYICMPVPQVKI
jgi:hypothetical protein